MGNFLMASYSLRIKKIYDDTKEKIPSELKGTLLQNQKNIAKFTLPLVKKAWGEGIKMASATIGEDVTKPDLMPKKIETYIYKKFFIRMKGAENVYKVRLDMLKELNKMYNKKINMKSGNQEGMIIMEYQNAVSGNVNGLIIEAGRQGTYHIWER